MSSAPFDAGEGAVLGGAHSRFIQCMLNRDWKGLAAQCSPTLVEHDHRHIIGLGTTRGPEAWVEKNVRVWIDLAPDITNRFTHLRGCDRGVLWQISLEGTREGGRFEISFAGVTELDERRRYDRIDLYDIDQLDQARARFEELKQSIAPALPFANAATRLNERIVRAWTARDWEAVSALHTSAVRLDDRRRLMHMRFSAEDSMAQMRFLFDVPGSRFVVTPIATRGERLSLSNLLFEGDVEEGGGALAIDYLAVDEVNAEGHSVELVLFDPGDLDAAYAELDARFDAGEGSELGGAASAFVRAITNRDWQGLFALCAPTFVEHDHRRITGLGITRGPEDWIEKNIRIWFDLAPDLVSRFTCVRGRGRAIIWQMVIEGTREGGRFEIGLAGVTEIDEQCRYVRNDIYDLDRLDLAQARFEEIGASFARGAS